MQRLSLACLLIVLVPLSTVSARDMTEHSMLTGQLRLGLSGNDKFGYVIGHELQDEHEERMRPLETDPGFGASLSYRRGITSSVLLGLSLDYHRSGTLKQEIDGEVVELLEDREDTTSATLGSYSLYGAGVSLHPGVGITEQLMVFGELGLGGYSVRLAGHDQELNAALVVGASAHYFVSESLGVELGARMPLFLAEFTFLDQGYTLDPSPLELSLGVAWLR